MIFEFDSEDYYLVCSECGYRSDLMFIIYNLTRKIKNDKIIINKFEKLYYSKESNFFIYTNNENFIIRINNIKYNKYNYNEIKKIWNKEKDRINCCNSYGCNNILYDIRNNIEKLNKENNLNSYNVVFEFQILLKNVLFKSYKIIKNKMKIIDETYSFNYLNDINSKLESKLKMLKYLGDQNKLYNKKIIEVFYIIRCDYITKNVTKKQRILYKKLYKDGISLNCIYLIYRNLLIREKLFSEEKSQNYFDKYFECFFSITKENLFDISKHYSLIVFFTNLYYKNFSNILDKKKLELNNIAIIKNNKLYKAYDINFRCLYHQISSNLILNLKLNRKY